MPQVAIWLG